MICVDVFVFRLSRICSFLVGMMDTESLTSTELVGAIATNIQRLSQNVQHLESLISKIGSNDDDDNLREQIKTVKASASATSKYTNTLMKQLVTLSNDQRSLKVQRERLMAELISVLNRLQMAQRNASRLEQQSMKAVSAQEGQITLQIENGDERERLEKGQLQIRRQQHLNEIRERNEAVRQLDQDISDVTQIMKDLARIVHDQGEIVDSIEANVEDASVQVQQGSVNVQRAVFYEQKARQKKFFIFIFLFALLLILALGAYFFFK
ncbi:hypothetical protein AB6A40_009584 [Gnathostoma spinigerum]|uniref:t-SNARE coiled-coil homology domain-containing protein n=1 Tax=Gnathostoma spinigerum TaxID=75299 RepID=A0ABD6F1U2_9BILA